MSGAHAALVHVSAQELGYGKHNFCWLHAFESPSAGLYSVERGVMVLIADNAEHGILNGTSGWLMWVSSCISHNNAKYISFN